MDYLLHYFHVELLVAHPRDLDSSITLSTVRLVCIASRARIEEELQDEREPSVGKGFLYAMLVRAIYQMEMQRPCRRLFELGRRWSTTVLRILASFLCKGELTGIPLHVRSYFLYRIRHNICYRSVSYCF
jgi:hypothetical protein